MLLVQLGLLVLERANLLYGTVNLKIFKYSALPKAIEVLEFFAASLFFDIEGYVSYLAEHFQKNCFLPKISTYALVTVCFVI